MTATPDTERTPIGAAALAALWWDAIVTDLCGDGGDPPEPNRAGPDPELRWADMSDAQRSTVVTATEAILGSLHALTELPTEGQPDTALPDPTPQPSEKATPDDAQTA